MAFEATEFSDCMQISKKFERAASWAPTEEATFALAGIALDNMRISATSYLDLEENSSSLSIPQTSQQKIKSTAQTANGLTAAGNVLGDEVEGVNLRNLDKADEDEDFFQRISGNFFPNTGNVKDLGGIFNSECIPCGFRIDHMGHLTAELFTSPLGGISEFVRTWKEAFREMLRQILDLLNIFNGLNNFVDLCALLKFLNDFVCIPDLQRMLSALMALMNRYSFEFGGVITLIIQLVGPLLTPLLSSFIQTLTNYILMIIKPLECIIDSIQAIIAKLDYNVLFQNIDALDRNPPMKSRKQDPRDPIKIPFIDAYIQRRDIVRGEGVLDQYNSLSVSMRNRGIGALGGDAIKAENAKEQAAVEQAARELQAIRAASRNIDASKPDAVKKQRAKEQAAQKKYQSALDEKNLSKLGQANKSISQTTASLKSSLFLMIQKLREAASVIEGFFQNLFDEFKKLLGEYVGGNGGLIGLIVDKMGLVQLIGLISSIIAAFASGLNCDGDDEDIRVENFIPEQEGMKVWTDDQGNLHIEEDPSGLEDIVGRAVNDMVQAIGVSPPGGAVQKEQDKGSAPSTARQRLNSLIEFTGDPVLDEDIARATQKLTTPTNVTFKCPLQSTATDAEKINTWIQELR